MFGGSIPERYVRLCLRLGALDEDLVDAYIGPAPLREESLADGPHEPAILREEALALLEEVPGADLEGDRVEWLLGQLRGIECVTARLAGQDIAWTDQVERCFGIRMITAAPEAVIAEGIATNALEMAMGGDGFGALLGAVGDLGVSVDAAVAEVVYREERWLYAVAANVARMLHEDGMSADEAELYLQEWALDPPDRAARTVGFLTDPGSWAYITAYTDGKRLCRSFVDAHPDGFGRLLTEQLTVSSL